MSFYVRTHRHALYQARLNRVGRRGLAYTGRGLCATRHGLRIYMYARSGSNMHKRAYAGKETLATLVGYEHFQKVSVCFERSQMLDDWSLAKCRGGKRVFLCLRRKITRRMPEPLGNERFHNFVNAMTRALYFRAYELNDVRSANRRVETQLRKRAIKLQLLFCKFHSKIFSNISRILLRQNKIHQIF